MPKRLLVPVIWLERHVREHPRRLFASMLAVLFATLALLGFSLYANLSAAHSANVQICRSVNELRRQIFVLAVDSGVKPALAERLLPETDCEALP